MSLALLDGGASTGSPVRGLRAFRADRVCLPGSIARSRTPWGEADQFRIRDGILFCQTSTECFCWLDAARNAFVHPAFRSADGFYTESVDGTKVCLFLAATLSLGLSVGVDDNSRNLAAHLFQCCLQTVQM